MPRAPASSSQRPNHRSQPRKGRARDNSDDDDEFEVNDSHVASQSQTQSMTQADKRAAQLNPDLVARKVGELVQYLLIMEQKKAPVRRGDITKNVLKAEYRFMLPHVLKMAKTKLKMTFGLDLVELVHKVGKSQVKMYILLNKIDMEQQGGFLDSSQDDHKVGLLLVVLSIIFMNGGTVTEADLWHSLGKLGLHEDEKNHDVFGDVRKLIISEFGSKQMYLDYSRIPNTDPIKSQFKWGIRAQAECTKRKVLEFVCKIYGEDMEPESWKEQHREVLLSENKGGRVRNNSATSSSEDESDESNEDETS